MRKKRILSLLISFVLFMALFAFLRFFVFKTEQPSSVSEVIFEVNSDDVLNISVGYNGESIHLLKEENEWLVENDRQFPLEQSFPNNMLSVLNQLTSTNLVTTDREQFDEYELNQPQCTVSIIETDGTETLFYFGMQNQNSGDYYLRMNDSSSVFTVASSVAEAFFHSLYDMIELDTVPSVSTALINDLLLKNQNGVIEFVYHMDGLESEYTSSYEWFMNKPFTKLTAANGNKTESIIYSVLELKADGCLIYNASQADLEQYGLSKPRATFSIDYIEEETVQDENFEDTIVSHERQFELYIGNEDTEKGITYFKLSNSNMIMFVVTDAISDLITVKAEDLIPNDICLINLETVTQMKVTTGGKSYTFSLAWSQQTDDQGEIVNIGSYTINGEEIDSDKFENFYSLITNMYPENSADDGDKITADPYVTIEFTRNTKNYKKMTLSFLPYNTNFYLVRFNGNNSQLVNIRNVQSFVSELQSF